ncbi:MAG: hypothetical protein JWQ72_3509 [Polaromonas sp.]|nr:hypothetical protein [Polaromonas sp.]
MKPALLLIPGMLNTAAIWGRVVPLLQDAADVLIADVQSQSSIRDMARDAWAQAAALPAAQPLVLAGFSMGGYVAIEMLAACARPVRAAALLSTSGRPETADGRALREKTIAAIGRDFDKVVAQVAAFGTNTSSQGDTLLMDELMAAMRGVGADTAARQNRAVMDRADHRETLARLDLPVLVACGRADRITPPALSEELAAGIPGARLECIEGAGHMTPLEQPGRVAVLLKTLL